MQEETEVEVRIEHKTARAVLVSVDGGETSEWVPLEAILEPDMSGVGPGDTLTITVSEKTATEKGLV